MKSKIFYCDSYYRAALIEALVHLGILEDENMSIGKLLRLTWWSRIITLKPGQILEIGCNSQGARIYIISVARDKDLLPRIACTLASAIGSESEVILIDALPQGHRFIKWARWLAMISGINCFSHYLFLTGILKLRKEAWHKKGAKSLLSS